MYAKSICKYNYTTFKRWTSCVADCHNVTHAICASCIWAVIKYHILMTQPKIRDPQAFAVCVCTCRVLIPSFVCAEPKQKPYDSYINCPTLSHLAAASCCLVAFVVAIISSALVAEKRRVAYSFTTQYYCYSTTRHNKQKQTCIIIKVMFFAHCATLIRATHYQKIIVAVDASNRMHCIVGLN